MPGSTNSLLQGHYHLPEYHMSWKAQSDQAAKLGSKVPLVGVFNLRWWQCIFQDRQ